MNVADYQFFAVLSRHPKLPPAPLGILMLDQFARVTLSQDEQPWAAAAMVPFLTIAERFKGERHVAEFLGKFATLAIS